MLAALVQGELKIARDTEKTETPFQCPQCKGRLSLHKGYRRTHHFAHLPPFTCSYGKGESELHRRAKYGIYDALKMESRVTKLGIELCIARDPVIVPDIRLCLNERTYIGIEVQASTLGPAQIAERTRRYRAHGMYVLWVVPELRKMADDERYSPREYERFLHAMYFGKVFYWADGDRVTPVHYDPFWLYKEPNEYGSGGDYASRRWVTPRFLPTVRIGDLSPIARKPWDVMNIPAANLWTQPGKVPSQEGAEESA